MKKFCEIFFKVTIFFMKFMLIFSDLTDSMVELGPQAYKIVRQCLRQLDLLKNVWQTILPELVYNKSLGAILNDLCDEIIRKVVKREDISSSVANGLVNICDVIFERAPALFAVIRILLFRTKPEFQSSIFL